MIFCGILRRVSDHQQWPGMGPPVVGNADQKLEKGFRSRISESVVQQVLGMAAQNFPPGSNKSHVALQKIYSREVLQEDRRDAHQEQYSGRKGAGLIEDNRRLGHGLIATVPFR